MKRVVILTDEELDRVISWHDSASADEDRDYEDEDVALAEKLRAARLSP